MAPRPTPQAAPQPPEEIASALEAFLAEYPAAAVLEDGRILFDLRTRPLHPLHRTRPRCTLHLWDEHANLIRRILRVDLRRSLLRLTTQRFGQPRPQVLELTADRDRRTPTTREAGRTRYLRTLERALSLRAFPEWARRALPRRHGPRKNPSAPPTPAASSLAASRPGPSSPSTTRSSPPPSMASSPSASSGSLTAGSMRAGAASSPASASSSHPAPPPSPFPASPGSTPPSPRYELFEC